MLTGRVLLLNFSYEPLGTVGVARSVCLFFRGAVFVEENDGDNVLHSPSITFPVPSVIRLRHYVHVRRNNRVLTIQWREDRGFGLSSAAGGYGEGADEVYSTPSQVEVRVAELLDVPVAAR